MEAFSGAADDDDAVDVFVFGEFFGELCEAFDGPAFCWPGTGWGEDGVGLWVFDDYL